jgi:hypothetical protein
MVGYYGGLLWRSTPIAKPARLRRPARQHRIGRRGLNVCNTWEYSAQLLERPGRQHLMGARHTKGCGLRGGARGDTSGAASQPSQCTLLTWTQVLSRPATRLYRHAIVITTHPHTFNAMPPCD